MIDRHLLAIIISYPTSASGIIIIPLALVGYNYCFIKNNQEILLDLTDFVLSEQPEDNNLFKGHYFLGMV